MDEERVQHAIEILQQSGHDDPARLAAFERYALAGHWSRAYRILYKSPICGARRPSGLQCLASPLHGKRCKRHGGGSIIKGPRTQAGRDRIAAGQLRRWARWREARAAATASRSPSNAP